MKLSSGLESRNSSTFYYCRRLLPEGSIQAGIIETPVTIKEMMIGGKPTVLHR